MKDTYQDGSCDFSHKFISENLRQIKNGGVSYAYSQKLVNELTRLLDNLKIKYTVKHITDEVEYWTIYAESGRNKVGRPSKA